MKSLNLKNTLISLETPIIMGILNITEDSFYDGGNYVSETAVLKRVEQMLEEGATIVDLGAVSTQPNAPKIDEKQEFESVKKNLQIIFSHFPDVSISVDTFRAKVADMAISEGAAMINDISGGEDPNMFDIAGKYKVPYILTHNNRNTPLETKELIHNMLSFFGNNIEKLISNGVKDIIIDPGFGFGKTLEQNYYILKHFESFSIFNFPILAGVSRKSMIYKLLDTTPADSLAETIVINTILLYNNVTILRVHDVKQCKDTVEILNIIHSL
jgi:dihydropteroate synthase